MTSILSLILKRLLIGLVTLWIVTIIIPGTVALAGLLGHYFSFEVHDVTS